MLLQIAIIESSRLQLEVAVPTSYFIKAIGIGWTIVECLTLPLLPPSSSVSIPNRCDILYYEAFTTVFCATLHSDAIQPSS